MAESIRLGRSAKLNGDHMSDELIIGGNSEKKAKFHITITLLDPEISACKVESDAPNYDVILNLLAQAARYVEDKRREAIAIQQFQQMQAQQMAETLMRRPS